MKNVLFKPHPLWLNSFLTLRNFFYILFISVVGLGSCQESTKGSGKPIAANIDGEDILLSDLDLTIQNQLYETLFGVYYMRRIALEELIAQRLLDKEAKIRNVSKEKLLEVELASKKDQASLEKFISENHLENGIPDRNNPLRLISLETEEGKKNVGEAFEKKVLERYVESLKVKYNIKTYLEAPSPPKLNLGNLMAHSRGSNAPLLNVWIASDFNCSECQKYHAMFESLYEQYADKVKFNFTHLSPEITLSAVVAECCAEQGKFWEIHDLIFRTMPRDTADFLGIAERIGVDKNKLLNCLRNSSGIQNQIGSNISQLNALHLNVTPTLIVDGTQYYGEFSFEKIAEYFDEVISRKKMEE